MKNGVENPATLIDLNRFALAPIEPLPEGGLRLGAMARHSDMADHPSVRQQLPLLSQAILSGARYCRSCVRNDRSDPRHGRDRAVRAARSRLMAIQTTRKFKERRRIDLLPLSLEDS
jgi:hypothetical protein